jgi:dihydrofolate reductase
MGKLTLYIAASMDGYIAKENGDVAWLHEFPNPDHPDYGYAAFYSTVGTLVMGRKTYEEIVGFGIEWPYPGIKSYIATRQPGFAIHSPDTFLLGSPAEEHLTELKKETEKDVWLVGGGELVSFCLERQLLDRLIITYMPITLGSGLPFFPGKNPGTRWDLASATTFGNGVITLNYRKKD